MKKMEGKRQLPVDTVKVEVKSKAQGVEIDDDSNLSSSGKKNNGEALGETDVGVSTNSITYRYVTAILYPVKAPLLKLLNGPLKDRHRLHIILKFLVLAIRNPVEFYKMITFRRIRNLFLLLFKRQDLIEQVVGGYNEALRPTDRTCIEFKVPNYTDNELEQIKFDFPVWEQPKVSVVIPVYNQINHTINCLRSIRKYWPETSIEIVIADDCSTDKTSEVIGASTGISLIKNKENIGFVRSCNNAVALAKGEYVFLLNNDTAVCEGWLDTLLAVIVEHDDVELVGSKLLYPNGMLQEAGSIVWSDGSGCNFGRYDDPDKPEYNYLKEVDYISGAAIMFSRDFFMSSGGFDERYAPAYYEDTDLAFTVRKAGKKVYFQPASQIIHYEGISNGLDGESGLKEYQAVNKDKFYQKWEGALKSQPPSSERDYFFARERSEGKKTVLVIDHYVPHFDKDAGSRSTHMYLELLVKSGFNVKFLGDNFYKHEPYTSALQQLGIEVLYGERYRKGWKEWLEKNCKHIDVVYTMRPHISQKYIDFINKLPNRPKLIYFGHDLHFLRLERQFSIERKSSLIKEAKNWKRQELEILKKVDVSYYPSSVEVEEIKKIDSRINVRAIPLNIYPEKKAEESHQNRADMLFVGGFNHEPNKDGIKWFCDEVMPKVVHFLPEIKLHIVGSNVTKEIKALKSSNIIVHGSLSDEELTRLYLGVKISVVPLRYGAGVKGKVLEAMYRGLPIVTTSIGGEGIEGAEKCMVIEDEAVGFASQLVSLYNDEEKIRSMVKMASDVIAERFSETAALKILTEDFKKVS